MNARPGESFADWIMRIVPNPPRDGVVTIVFKRKPWRKRAVAWLRRVLLGWLA